MLGASYNYINLGATAYFSAPSIIAVDKQQQHSSFQILFDGLELANNESKSWSDAIVWKID